MLKKLFKLTAMCTVLSLAFITTSCKTNDSETLSQKERLEGIVHFGGAYMDEDKDAYTFLPGNILQIKSVNSFREIVNTYKISGAVANKAFKGQYTLQTKLISSNETLLKEEVVKAANEGKLEDENGVKYDLDIPSSIRGWKLNEPKSLMAALPETDREGTYIMTVSEDQDTLTLRHIMLDDGSISDPETLTYKK